jgi:hypothetical protein
MRLLERLPDRFTASSSPLFAALSATASRLRDRLHFLEHSALHFPGACRFVQRLAVTVLLSVQAFDTAISDCTRRFLALDSISNLVGLGYRMLAFLKLVCVNPSLAPVAHFQTRFGRSSRER